MFELRIAVESIEQAELYIDHLRTCFGSGPVGPSVLQVAEAPRDRGTVPAALPDYLAGPVTALQELQARHGLADVGAPLGVLARFGVNNIRQLAPADYAAFVVACNAA